MRIAVCIKQVPVVSALELDPETKTLKREGVRTEVSSFDLRAVMKAVALRDMHGGEVVVVTMGPPPAREALVECLALGADRGMHLCDKAFAGADTLATAQALALALRDGSFDLILCGRNSIDAETGQVGPEIAELLDIPQVTGACSLSIDVDARRLTAERETDSGIETVTAPLPALVSAAEDLAAERFASKAERAAALEKPIEEVKAANLDERSDLFGTEGSPTWVLRIEAVAVERQGEILDGDSPQAIVDTLVERLLVRGLFGEWKVGTRTQPAPMPATSARSGEKHVLVVGELMNGALRPVTLELLHKAMELAQPLGGGVSVLLAGPDAARHVETLSAYGAGRVLLAESDSVAASTEPFAALLTQVIRDERPGLVLLPSSVVGRDVAPRVAARLRIGLTGDCIDLTVDGEGRVLQHKPAFGGMIVALIASRTRPEMATIRPGMLAIGEPKQNRMGTSVRVRIPESSGRVRVTSSRSMAEAATDLDHAAVVVGVGKGIGSVDNLTVMRELAGVLDASLCATRDVTDAGWLPKQCQVGITGRAIAPQLYLAVAVRGAFEHTVGIRRAGLIVAINKSAKAPIFKVCDYGIVGDYSTFVPILTERLRVIRNSPRQGS
jgi:electron transfer flavoprotein alpha subunit